MMSQFGAYKSLDSGDGLPASTGIHSRHLPINSPERSHRRVIFPSLHGSRGVCPSRDPQTEAKWRHQQSCLSNNNLITKERARSFQLPRSSTNVGEKTLHITSDPDPILLRVNSLDGISIPLPKLSLSEHAKFNEDCSPPMRRSISHLRTKSVPPSKCAALPPSAGSSPDKTKPPKFHFFGDTARHRMHYLVASTPAPVHGKTSPARSRPLTSILRRRKMPLSPPGSWETSSRHKSPECRTNDEQVMFDPHVIVFEFRLTKYEMKGGWKWWTGYELEQFKQEAVKRTRLRGASVIATGIMRTPAVVSKRKRGKVTPANAKTSRQSRGPVLFNHSASGCDDEFLPGSQSARKSPMKGTLPLEKSASNKIMNILLADIRETFLALFTKSL